VLTYTHGANFAPRHQQSQCWLEAKVSVHRCKLFLRLEIPLKTGLGVLRKCLYVIRGLGNYNCAIEEVKKCYRVIKYLRKSHCSDDNIFKGIQNYVLHRFGFIGFFVTAQIHTTNGEWHCCRPSIFKVRFLYQSSNYSNILMPISPILCTYVMCNCKTGCFKNRPPGLPEGIFSNQKPLFG
jgi:hypothetical protein